MSGKVDGFAPRVQVPTSTTPTAAPAAAAPAPAATPAPAASAPKPAATFDASAPTRRFADAQTGAPVPTSANPNSLWGEGHVHGGHGGHGPRGPNGEQLTPEQLEAFKARRAQMQQKIDDRVGQLEHKWRYTRNTTKTNELWSYVHDSKKLDPDTRAKIESKLWKTDRDQARLDRLQAQAKSLGESGTPEQRTALAHQISQAKDAVSNDLSDANDVIKAAGLEEDHMAHAEATIDPNAAKEGNSLADLINSFVKFTSTAFYTSTSQQYERNQDDEMRDEKVDDQVLEHLLQVKDLKVKDQVTAQKTEMDNLQHLGVKH
ncbi:MAG: hypothetical protein QM723_28315 [Myxococcaceae bacterium]